MSVKTTAPADAQSAGRPNFASLGAPPRPQVNLLPPEIRSKRALGRTKALLVICLLVVVLAVGVAYVFAAMGRTQAAETLANTEAEVQRLMQEQAQYAEVPQIKRQIDTQNQARVMATATEVLWPKYLRAIQAVTPEGVSVVQLQTEMPGPGVETASSGSPLDIVNVGAISFTANAKTMPDLAAWMDGLNSIDGFGSATYSAATLVDDQGVVTYEITVQVRVAATVYEGRFDQQDDAQESADEGTDESAGEDAGADQEVGEH